MNIDDYKSATPGERAICDLLVELIKAVKALEPEIVDLDNMGPLDGIDDLQEATKIATGNQQLCE